jgi:hypothetical protein
MKKSAPKRRRQTRRAARLQTPVLPRLPEQIRLLAKAACAALGGIGHLSLDEWHDVQQQLKPRLENGH